MHLLKIHETFKFCHSIEKKLQTKISRHSEVLTPVRICKFCDKNQVEDELQFLLECFNYEQFRENAVRTIFEKDTLNQQKQK